MYIKKWLLLPQTERIFYNVFQDVITHKELTLEFKEYYNCFKHRSFSEAYEWQMKEDYQRYYTLYSYTTEDNKLVFVEPPISLLVIREELREYLINLFKAILVGDTKEKLKLLSINAAALYYNSTDKFTDLISLAVSFRLTPNETESVIKELEAFNLIETKTCIKRRKNNAD